MHPRSVRRQVKTLQELGELEVEPRGSEFGTNVYRIPFVTAGVIVSSKEQIELYEVKKETYNKNRERDIGSSEDKLSREDYDDVCRGLSYLFAQALVDAGRKKAIYLSDADSEEWIYGVEKLLLQTHAGRGLELSEIEAVMRHAASSGTWRYVNTPRGLASAYPEVLADFRTEAEDSERHQELAETREGGVGGEPANPEPRNHKLDALRARAKSKASRKAEDSERDQELAETREGGVGGEPANPEPRNHKLDALRAKAESRASSKSRSNQMSQ